MKNISQSTVVPNLRGGSHRKPVYAPYTASGHAYIFVCQISLPAKHHLHCPGHGVVSIHANKIRHPLRPTRHSFDHDHKPRCEPSVVHITVARCTYCFVSLGPLMTTGAIDRPRSDGWSRQVDHRWSDQAGDGNITLFSCHYSCVCIWNGRSFRLCFAAWSLAVR